MLGGGPNISALQRKGGLTAGRKGPSPKRKEGKEKRRSREKEEEKGRKREKKERREKDPPKKKCRDCGCVPSRLAKHHAPRSSAVGLKIHV